MAHDLYWGGFGASFILGIPLTWLFRWVPTDHAIGHGLADGSRDGRDEANRKAANLKGTDIGVPRSLMLTETAVC